MRATPFQVFVDKQRRQYEELWGAGSSLSLSSAAPQVNKPSHAPPFIPRGVPSPPDDVPLQRFTQQRLLLSRIMAMSKKPWLFLQQMLEIPPLRPQFWPRAGQRSNAGGGSGESDGPIIVDVKATDRWWVAAREKFEAKLEHDKQLKVQRINLRAAAMLMASSQRLKSLGVTGRWGKEPQAEAGQPNRRARAKRGSGKRKFIRRNTDSELESEEEQ